MVEEEGKFVKIRKKSESVLEALTLNLIKDTLEILKMLRFVSTVKKALSRPRLETIRVSFQNNFLRKHKYFYYFILIL
jgi:hypothetical protein